MSMRCIVCCNEGNKNAQCTIAICVRVYVCDCCAACSDDPDPNRRKALHAVLDVAPPGRPPAPLHFIVTHLSVRRVALP